MTSFLIVHGWKNRRPKAHWQHWLARELRAQHHQVRYPRLPDTDHPKPAEWVAVLRSHLTRMRHGERIAICHSLGCMAWLRLAMDSGSQLPVDRLLFVAPPSPAYVANEPELVAFQPPEPVGALVASTSRIQPRLVCSDNDPYCKEGADSSYPSGFDVDLVPHAGHLDMTAGYGDWPSVLAWCSNPAVRITARADTAAATVPATPGSQKAAR